MLLREYLTAAKLLLFSVCVLLLHVANKQLVHGGAAASERPRGDAGEGGSKGVAAARVALFVQLLLCVAAFADAVVDITEQQQQKMCVADTCSTSSFAAATADLWQLNRTIDRTVRAHSDKRMQQLHDAWWWSHHHQLVRARQLYQQHVRRVHWSTALLLYEGTARAIHPASAAAATDYYAAQGKSAPAEHAGAVAAAAAAAGGSA